MHLNSSELYTFIDDICENKILNLKNNYNVIFRNYHKKVDLKKILKIKKICKKKRIKFYLANNPKLALQANLDGVYIPSFNKSLNLNNLETKEKTSLFLVLHTVFQR